GARGVGAPPAPRRVARPVGAPVGAPGRPHVASAATLVQSLPRPLLEAVREPFSARAVVYALLLAPEPSLRREQLAHLEAAAERGTAAAVQGLFPLIAPLSEAVWRALAGLGLAARRQLSRPQYQQFRERVDDLVASDRKLSLFEFALRRLLRRHLDRQFRISTATADQPAADVALSEYVALLLSALAHAGHADL